MSSPETIGPPAPADPYPVQLDVEYPERPLNRVTTFFRLLLAIPVLILLELFVQCATSTRRLRIVRR